MTALTDAAAPNAALRVHRIEVRSKPGELDPLADSVLAEARKVCGSVEAVHAARVYLIQAPLSDSALERIASELLTDPITQTYTLGVAESAGGASVEVHYQPGVMDPVAQSTREAIVEMLPEIPLDAVEVRTGFRYDFINAQATADALRRLAEQSLANPVIQDIHVGPFVPERFPAGSAYTLRLVHVPIRQLDDAALTKMSREAHLFLSLEEMRAIRDYFQGVGREPTDIELETLAQTWSEHCVHKTLKSTITYRESSGPGKESAGGSMIDFAARPGHVVNPDGSVTIQNLLKSTIAAATNTLMEQEHFGNWCVSVFKDNAGIVRFDESDGVCIKVETHNHPSAIEPYGGAATGIGGCIRDVMGTGLAARPIANTDVFCVAFPDSAGGQGPRAEGHAEGDLSSSTSLGPGPSTPGPQLPKGVIAPDRILKQVVAGVRDYGNRMGIPTVNGAVWFHEDYLANPLVFAGCIGLIPLDKCFGHTRSGDRIIALGGRTGRDGIHGATFSSAELTDTHADEFAHAVQIGNAITQKKTLDVILQARDQQDGPLFSAITDCGAGGFSSAVGEMGKDLGAYVTLEAAPLKYQGLSYTEIWISEAQERMVLAVPPEKVARLKALCQAEDVEMCDLGQFGWNQEGATEPVIVLTYQGTEVGRLSTHFLHEGIPTPTREARWEGGGEHGQGEQGQGRKGQGPREEKSARIAPVPSSSASSHGPSSLGPASSSLGPLLLALLSHPNIASKHWIIRQYDHEVQGGSVVKPLAGRFQDGPGDAAVLRPKLNTNRAIAIGCGLQTGLGEKTPGGDSYWMALAAIDEAVRNVVCAGADPQHIAILDNFCWPRCDDPRQLGSLVRAAEACYDGALAYRTPFVSGKDSLSNQFTTEDGKLITIPPTLLITALGIVPDAAKACTMDAKGAGNLLLIVGESGSELGGSHYLALTRDNSRDTRIPHVNLQRGPGIASAVADLIAQGLVRSAHDCSDGGLLVAAAEMAFAGRIGLDLDLDPLPVARELDDLTACFVETPSRYLLEIAPEQLDATVRSLRAAGVPFAQIGRFTTHDHLTVRCARHGRLLDLPLDQLRSTWLNPLDW